MMSRHLLHVEEPIHQLRILAQHCSCTHGCSGGKKNLTWRMRRRCRNRAVGPVSARGRAPSRSVKPGVELSVLTHRRVHAHVGVGETRWL